MSQLQSAIATSRCIPTTDVLLCGPVERIDTLLRECHGRVGVSPSIKDDIDTAVHVDLEDSDGAVATLERSTRLGDDECDLVILSITVALIAAVGCAVIRLIVTIVLLLDDENGLAGKYCRG